MALRLKKYRFRGNGDVVRAIRITEKNLAEIVDYINNQGGAATGHLGNTRSGKKPRIRIKQRNFGENWGKVDWRVAYIGDFIVRDDYEREFKGVNTKYKDFSRVKDDIFEAAFELVK